LTGMPVTALSGRCPYYGSIARNKLGNYAMHKGGIVTRSGTAEKVLIYYFVG